MDLIIITPEINHPNEIESIHAFFENGLSKLHLRKPLFTTSDYRNFLNQIDTNFHSRISIHGNFSLLKEFPCLGIHITAQIRESEKFSEIIDLVCASTCSTSFHSWKEIENNQYPFDYVFISPVFNSISKKGYTAAIDLSVIRKVKQKNILKNEKTPSIIALGGVDAANIGLLYQNGFDGVAILGAIWESENPIASFIKIKKTIKGFEDA
ncbi:thiamine-phosphate synthase [mine drainage metagenome]|uniref:Thiamine-phosphate synthase n=1 Tax=mine drainage metagenome TaxID=410659 RepID=A0A1J5SHX6_9ZZZZ